MALILLILLILPIVATVLAAIALSRTNELRGEIRRLQSSLSRLQSQPGDRESVERKTARRKPAGVVREAAPVMPLEKPPPPPERVAPRRPVVSSRPQPPPTPVTAPKRIDWEKFTGGRLFAWVGGLALFLGILFLVKYSIDQGLISPVVRLAGSFLLGTACIVAGLWLYRSRYRATAHALCAAGPAILYVVIYASHHFYGFIGVSAAFLFMILVTSVAFLLAVRLESRYIALLGLLGGFLTPPSFSTGIDRPLTLFGYLAFLDAGLALIALRMRWGFLVPLAALATALMQIGWTSRFFAVEKAATALGIQLFFSTLFAGAGVAAHLRRTQTRTILASAAAMSLFSLSMVFWMMSNPELAQRPGLMFSVVLVFNLLLSGLVILRSEIGWAYPIGLAITFLTLLDWTLDKLTPSLLPWGLAFFLIFGALHAVAGVMLKRRHPDFSLQVTGLAFPAGMLVMILSGLASLGHTPLGVWPFVLLLDLVALGAALLSGILWLGGVMLILTLATVWVGISQLAGSGGLVELLLVTAFFSLGFLAAGLFVRARPSQSLAGKPSGASDSVPPWTRYLGPESLPILSTLLPFVLLMAVFFRLDLVNPSPVFGLAVLLVALILGMALYLRIGAMALAGLASVALLEATWHGTGFDSSWLQYTLPWYVLFLLIFALFPFAFQRRIEQQGSRLPWIASALAGPVHFFLIFDALPVSRGQVLAGVLTLGFGLFYLAGLLRLLQVTPSDHPQRSMRLALFGAVVLFFVSLAFPVVFEKEWLTVGWALEGLALVWLFERVPHPGLKKWALVLLATAFVRLALNPSVLVYHPRAEIPLLNWYLYAYGAVIACLMLAAHRWRLPQEALAGLPVPPTLKGMGAVLAFLLLNIEIADFFSQGRHLTFQFGSSLAQDMTYSLAWAGFGLALLVIGIGSGSRGARLGALGLLAVTTLKLFLYDLWRLGQLYRVGAFVGLAVMLILVSFLYQRYFGEGEKPRNPP